MAEDRVVIGNGPSALRAAAALSTGDWRVTLITSGPDASGLGAPELAQDSGRLRVAPEHRALVEQVLGPLRESAPLRRALQVRGNRFDLPLHRAEVARLFPVGALGGAAQSWVTTRTRNALSQVLGGGAEERTYRDWVVRRMGGPAYHHLYRSYAERRFGAAAEDLASSVARVFHGGPEDGQLFQAEAADTSANAARLLQSNGGRVVVGQVRALRVEEGRVVGVVLADGEVEVKAPLWIARSPRVIARWLGEEHGAPLRVDSDQLRVGRAVAVALRGPTEGLPDELHVLDEGAPFWRVVPHPHQPGVAIFHFTLGPDAEVPPGALVVDRVRSATGALGLGEFSAEGATVQSQAEHRPVWLEVGLARLRRVQLRWRDLGIVGVGRAGTFAPLDAAEEIAHAAVLRDEANPDQRELHRAYLAPPVKQDDLDSHITRWLTR